MTLIEEIYLFIIIYLFIWERLFIVKIHYLIYMTKI